MSTDAITKTIVLKAPRTRVWTAISDSAKFGAWFGVEFDGPFVPGESMSGKIVPTKVDPEIAASQEPYAGTEFDISVVAVEPEDRVAFRWHPGHPEEGLDYSKEPTTLVELVLSDAPGGTRLTVTESGFDGIPLERRAKVFELNEGGWEAQMQLVAKFVEGATTA